MYKPIPVVYFVSRNYLFLNIIDFLGI